MDFGLEVLGRHYKNLRSSIVITLFNRIFEVNVPCLFVLPWMLMEFVLSWMLMRFVLSERKGVMIMTIRDCMKSPSTHIMYQVEIYKLLVHQLRQECNGTITPQDQYLLCVGKYFSQMHFYFWKCGIFLIKIDVTL